MWPSVASLSYSNHLLQCEPVWQCCLLPLPHSRGQSGAGTGLKSPVGSRARVRNKLVDMNGLDLNMPSNEQAVVSVEGQECFSARAALKLDI